MIVALPLLRSTTAIGAAERFARMGRFSSNSAISDAGTGVRVLKLPTVFFIADGFGQRDAICDTLRLAGHRVELFDSATSFISTHCLDRRGCVLLDAAASGVAGSRLDELIQCVADELFVVVLGPTGRVAQAVLAMKAGAFDYLESPVPCSAVLMSIEQALRMGQLADGADRACKTAAQRIARLTARQRQIMVLVAAGHPSKNIAADLGISQRTVDNHRAAIMRRTESKTLSDLIRTALCFDTARASRQEPALIQIPACP